MGDAQSIRPFGGMDADSVCRSDVLRSGIYTSDIGTEKRRPNGGFSDIKLRIGVLRAGGMGDIEAGAECKRVVWVWADVLGDCVGAVAAEDS